MRTLTYYAVFEPSKRESFSVYWPDLPGCTSCGATLPQAQKEAIEALGLHIYGMEQDGETLPEATLPPYKNMTDNCIVMPVTVFPDIVKTEFDSRSVKTNITLPAWLKNWAVAQGINLSQTLQATLKQMRDTQNNNIL